MACRSLKSSSSSPLVVGDLEHQRQHAGLRVVEVEQPAEQQRPHLRDGRAHGMALLAEHVPERHGAGCELEVLELHLLYAFGDFGIVLARLADARQVPLTSAANTGTPMRLKASAITCSVTVLPVPVAPATRPWRFAICGSRTCGSLLCAMSRGSAITCLSGTKHRRLRHPSRRMGCLNSNTPPRVWARGMRWHDELQPMQSETKPPARCSCEGFIVKIFICCADVALAASGGRFAYSRSDFGCYSSCRNCGLQWSGSSSSTITAVTVSCTPTSVSRPDQSVHRDGHGNGRV